MRRKIQRRVLFFTVFVLIVLFVLNSLDGIFLKKIYPKKYEDIVKKYSQKYDVKENLIYSVMRTESNFDPNAKSEAGAIGLMQITPETFKWLQQKNKNLPRASVDELVNPDINIEYGVYFLSVLLNKYNNISTSLCAYNAGIGTVNDWLNEQKYSLDGKVLMNIPYKETRNYVKQVIKTEKIYNKIYF